MKKIIIISHEQMADYFLGELPEKYEHLVAQAADAANVALSVWASKCEDEVNKDLIVIDQDN